MGSGKPIPRSLGSLPISAPVLRGIGACYDADKIAEARDSMGKKLGRRTRFTMVDVLRTVRCPADVDWLIERICEIAVGHREWSPVWDQLVRLGGLETRNAAAHLADRARATFPRKNFQFSQEQWDRINGALRAIREHSRG